MRAASRAFGCFPHNDPAVGFCQTQVRETARAAAGSRAEQRAIGSGPDRRTEATPVCGPLNRSGVPRGGANRFPSAGLPGDAPDATRALPPVAANSRRGGWRPTAVWSGNTTHAALRARPAHARVPADFDELQSV